MVPFPIVVGCARSGTTLLRSMLDSHSELAVVDNTDMLSDLSVRARRYRPAGRFQVEVYLGVVSRHPGFSKLRIELEDLVAALHERPPDSLPEAVRATFALHAARWGKRRSGEKAPEYVLHLRRVGALLPEARFVHLVRDGRDVATALLDSHFGTDRLVYAAVQWEARIAHSRRAGEQLGPHRYREVRFEQLVAEPEDTLRSLCDFLELHYEPAMLEYHRRFDDDWPTPQSAAAHASLALPPTPGLRDWRRDLAPTQSALFELVAGRALKRSGYPLAGGRVAPGRHLMVRGEEGVARARQALRLGERCRRLRLLGKSGPVGSAPVGGD